MNCEESITLRIRKMIWKIYAQFVASFYLCHMTDATKLFRWKEGNNNVYWHEAKLPGCSNLTCSMSYFTGFLKVCTYFQGKWCVHGIRSQRGKLWHRSQIFYFLENIASKMNWSFTYTHTGIQKTIMGIALGCYPYFYLFVCLRLFPPWPSRLLEGKPRTLPCALSLNFVLSIFSAHSTSSDSVVGSYHNCLAGMVLRRKLPWISPVMPPLYSWTLEDNADTPATLHIPLPEERQGWMLSFPCKPLANKFSGTSSQWKALGTRRVLVSHLLTAQTVLWTTLNTKGCLVTNQNK